MRGFILRSGIIHLVPGSDLAPAERVAVIDVCTRAFDEDYHPFLEQMQDPTHVLAY